MLQEHNKGSQLQDISTTCFEIIQNQIINGGIGQ